MTFKDILKVPAGQRVSVFRALAALDIIRSSARSKMEVLTDTLPSDVDSAMYGNNKLMIGWFSDIAESADRQIIDLNNQSTL
jgi:hypothetical protein